VNTSQQHPNLFLTEAAAKQAPVQTSSGQAGSELNPPTNFSSLRGLFPTCEAVIPQGHCSQGHCPRSPAGCAWHPVGWGTPVRRGSDACQ